MKDFFSKEYLLWVIENYGQNQEIQSSNIIGEPRIPIRLGEYLISYGTASELLKKLLEGD